MTQEQLNTAKSIQSQIQNLNSVVEAITEALANTKVLPTERLEEILENGSLRLEYRHAMTNRALLAMSEFIKGDIEVLESKFAEL
jgi:hypothetical protein